MKRLSGQTRSGVLVKHWFALKTSQDSKKLDAMAHEFVGQQFLIRIYGQVIVGENVFYKDDSIIILLLQTDCFIF